MFAGRGDRFQTRAVYDKHSQQYILMPFDLCPSFVGLEIFLLTSAELSVALCQGERQFKRQAGEAVIQSEVLRISPGSSSFSNYPPAGILAVLDNNGCPGVRLSPLKCGWRKPHERRWDREMFAFLVMSFKEHNTRAKAVRQHGSTSVELGILPAMCDVIMKHVP